MVKKYVPFAGEDGLASMIESPSGGYVKVGDYSDLEDRLAELEGIIEELLEAVNDAKAASENTP